MDIEKLAKKIGEKTEGMIKDYQAELNEAFLKAEKGLTVRMGHKLIPEGGKVKIESSISFVEGQVKDKASYFLEDEPQKELIPH